VIEGSVTESDLPGSDSYRLLATANPQFEHMLREASRCATGANKRTQEQSQEPCKSCEMSVTVMLFVDGPAASWTNARKSDKWQKVVCISPTSDLSCTEV
jgi:hypothetical protein